MLVQNQAKFVYGEVNGDVNDRKVSVLPINTTQSPSHEKPIKKRSWKRMDSYTGSASKDLESVINEITGDSNMEDMFKKLDRCEDEGHDNSCAFSNDKESYTNNYDINEKGICLETTEKDIALTEEHGQNVDTSEDYRQRNSISTGKNLQSDDDTALKSEFETPVSTSDSISADSETDRHSGTGAIFL